jgi:hypothetical protein
VKGKQQKLLAACTSSNPTTAPFYAFTSLGLTFTARGSNWWGNIDRVRAFLEWKLIGFFVAYDWWSVMSHHRHATKFCRASKSQSTASRVPCLSLSLMRLWPLRQADYSEWDLISGNGALWWTNMERVLPLE